MQCLYSVRIRVFNGNASIMHCITMETTFIPVSSAIYTIIEAILNKNIHFIEKSSIIPEKSIFGLNRSKFGPIWVSIS